MTGKEITLDVTTYYWECECCGSGEHYEITTSEGKTYSHNDQFGGKLREQDDDLPDFVEYDMDPYYVAEDFIKAGYKVTLIINGTIQTGWEEEDFDEDD